MNNRNRDYVSRTMRRTGSRSVPKAAANGTTTVRFGLGLLFIALAALSSLRCGTSSAETRARAAEAKSSTAAAVASAPGAAGSGAAGSGTAAAAAASAAVPHGDHNPHHGGAVLMLRDLHYETVLEPTGRVAIYFSDAVRADLPASVVSGVYIEIDRPKHRAERVEMAIDAAGEAWEGRSMPVKQDDAIVRIAFTFQGEATSVDLPYHLYWKRVAAVPGPGTH